MKASRARLTAAGAITMTVLSTGMVAACSGGATTSSVPSIFAPSAGPAGVTPSQRHPGGPGPAPATSAGKGAGKGPVAAGSPSTLPTAPPPATSRVPASQPASSSQPSAPAPASTAAPASSPTQAEPVPSGAPGTGGGGTAGIEDGGLFGLGAAAVLAGLGLHAYRRRVTRSR